MLTSLEKQTFIGILLWLLSFEIYIITILLENELPFNSQPVVLSALIVIVEDISYCPICLWIWIFLNLDFTFSS